MLRAHMHTETLVQAALGYLWRQVRARPGPRAFRRRAGTGNGANNGDYLAYGGCFRCPVLGAL